jgi:hypothetical protein
VEILTVVKTFLDTRQEFSGHLSQEREPRTATLIRTDMT